MIVVLQLYSAGKVRMDTYLRIAFSEFRNSFDFFENLFKCFLRLINQLQPHLKTGRVT